MPSADDNDKVSFPHTTSSLTSSQTAQLTAALFAANAIPRIQAALSHSLQEAGWTHALRAHVLNLLRSGECGSYDELMARVLEDTRQQQGDNEDKEQNGNGVKNGGGAETGAARSAESIKIPDKAVREGIKAVRKEVEGVCEITFD